MVVTPGAASSLTGFCFTLRGDLRGGFAVTTRVGFGVVAPTAPM